MAELGERSKLARVAARLNAQSRSTRCVPALALLSDDERLFAPAEAIRALPQGSLVILRARDPLRRAQLAQICLPICRARRHILLIADDGVLASRCGADGLHLPQARHATLSYWRTRRPDWFISYAVHDMKALHHAARCGADAALVSPVFASQSHPGGNHLGLFRLAAFSRAAQLPVYALGGINGQNCLRIAGLQLAGIAAIGALSA